MSQAPSGHSSAPAASDRDAVIGSLAARQHGVVARAQLLRAGLPRHAIDYRVKRGRLRCLHRGIYRVGPVRGRLESEAAAVLACGETAVLSHRSAGHLWEMLRGRPEDPVEVSIGRGDRNPGPSVRVHRVTGLAVDETTEVQGIPVTTPARTVLDLAASVGEWELEQALARAERSGRGVLQELETLLMRYPRRSGTRVLRAILARDAEPALTRSVAESRFLALIRSAELPEPEANARIQGYEVDFLWRAQRLVVEIDGFEFHSSSSAFERDRLRDGALIAGGWRVLRVTWRQLTRAPEALLARVAQALARTGNQ